jgi:hypothetical protein
MGLGCLCVDFHDPFADVFKESDPTALKLSMSLHKQELMCIPQPPSTGN